MIPRPEWGAVHGTGFGDRRVGDLLPILHHTVTVAPDLLPPFDDDFRAVRTVEGIGQQRFGRGISYCALVTPVGLVFEGLPVSRIGAHTTGYNTTGYGIALVGNYQANEVPEPMQDAIVWLLRHGVSQGWWKTPAIRMGHRDVKSTSCPGDKAYRLIRSLNERAGGQGPTSPVAPPVMGDTRPRNADGSLTLAIDGSRGPAHISRWQEVMGTAIDGRITPPPVGSNLIRADQRFLNSVVDSGHIRNLTGRGSLDVDGSDGPKTVRVRQFWLYNRLAPQVLGRPARTSDFDGSSGPQTNRLHQTALNAATSGSGRY